MSDSVVFDIVAGILFSYSLIIFARCFIEEEMTRRTRRAMEEQNKKWSSVAFQAHRVLRDRMRMLEESMFDEESRFDIDDYIQTMEELKRKQEQGNQELIKKAKEN